MKVIRNYRIQDYLAENNCMPAYIDGEEFYYNRTPFLYELLDNYYIEYICLPNKRR